jgi:hypothetical protein
MQETDIEKTIRLDKEWRDEWASIPAWDGSTGHDPHCRAISQNIRGTMQTGPCNCKLSRKEVNQCPK